MLALTTFQGFTENLSEKYLETHKMQYENIIYKYKYKNIKSALLQSMNRILSEIIFLLYLESFKVLHFATEYIYIFYSKDRKTFIP